MEGDLASRSYKSATPDEHIQNEEPGSEFVELHSHSSWCKITYDVKKNDWARTLDLLVVSSPASSNVLITF
jgi:hypothetical protein